jgi:hypothetical protein
MAENDPNNMVKRVLSKRNIIILGGIFCIVGLLGPWLYFSEFDKGIIYHFSMSPLYLSIKSVPRDLNLSPSLETAFFYRVDATFLGVFNFVGGVFVIIGAIKSRMKLGWIGVFAIFLSIILFPTVLPVIFMDTVPQWGMIFTAFGMLLALVTLCIVFVSKKYDMGFPRR